MNYELGIRNYEGVCAEVDASIIPIIHYYICVGQIFFVLLQRKQQKHYTMKTRISLFLLLCGCALLHARGGGTCEIMNYEL